MSRWHRVYVAAPWEDGPLVREVHARLVDAHFRPMSSWAVTASGSAESLESVPQHEREAVLAQNLGDIEDSSAMIVLARHGAGGEMFAEFAYAFEYGLHLYWVGKRTILSTYRHGVRRCLDVNSAIAAMKEDLK